MKYYKALNCPNCGASIEFNPEQNISACSYCKSYLVSDYLKIENRESIQPRLLKPNVKFAANFIENSGNSLGGHLWVSTSEIFFKPHRFNFGNLSKKYLRIVDIVDYSKGWLGSITIKSRNGSMDLISWNRKSIIKAIEERKLSIARDPNVSEEIKKNIVQCYF
ncbi:hypothetical protein M2451_000554 [Dysgonomonas sp. PFB1-18]|uniref:hypothetical protein n=1 Tax=unclassified Dysgonomonas TaxID=2630389 RepID=UPI0024749ABC|nr:MULTISPECIES: hypothetical protein [unclassified Dysgonomonas]MDH6307405.1 hypothetical protein [Dysgonomonas sp. PF1-14]MDH6337323.1 hypothetical protein [Dysgonomonas sp. PF1-16]MDH6379247.1 hypothetical protein [Dysgonomonas sp. PFB1-18]MDH6396115.1 hypothetical protein [Dysgonomonas sp. PF1-23]